MSNKIFPKTSKGLWFYGLAGSGKTFASLLVSSLIDHSFVIDGDMVRKFVSTDLTYGVVDRKKQIGRIFGIGKIAIENRMFPIMSSVSMSNDLVLKCANEKIAVIQINARSNSCKRFVICIVREKCCWCRSSTSRFKYANPRK